MDTNIFKSKFINLVYNIISLLYPNFCIICGKLLINKEKHCVCNECWEKIEVFKEPQCKKCGEPLITADGICFKCKKKKYYYNEIRCIGKYDGVLKEVIQAYKYEGRFKLANYLVDIILENTENFLIT